MADKAPASPKLLVLDADHAVLGRAATQIAKQLLHDKDLHVVVVNVDKAVITGSPVYTFQRYRERRARGKERKGPFYPRRADRIFKRTVRGMLPYQREAGREALKRLKCFHGVPPAYKGKAGKIEGAHTLRTARFVTLGEIAKAIGAST
mgnify:CR=1 FL=1